MNPKTAETVFKIVLEVAKTVISVVENRGWHRQLACLCAKAQKGSLHPSGRLRCPHGGLAARSPGFGS